MSAVQAKPLRLPSGLFVLALVLSGAFDLRAEGETNQPPADAPALRSLEGQATAVNPDGMHWNEQGKFETATQPTGASGEASWQDALLEKSDGTDELRFWRTGDNQGKYRFYGSMGGVEGHWKGAEGKSGLYQFRDNRAMDSRPVSIVQTGNSIQIKGLSDKNSDDSYRILQPNQKWEEAAEEYVRCLLWAPGYKLSFKIEKVDETEEDVFFSFVITAESETKLRPATKEESGLTAKNREILYDSGFAPILDNFYNIADLFGNESLPVLAEETERGPNITDKTGNVIAIRPYVKAEDAVLGVPGENRGETSRFKGSGRASRYAGSWTVSGQIADVEGPDLRWSKPAPRVPLDSPAVRQITDVYFAALGQLATDFAARLRVLIGPTYRWSFPPDALLGGTWFKNFQITAAWNPDQLGRNGSFRRLFDQQRGNELLEMAANEEKGTWSRTEHARFARLPKPDLYRVLPGKPIYALIYVDGEPRAAVGRPLGYTSRSADSALIVSFFFLRTLRADSVIDRIDVYIDPKTGGLSLGHLGELVKATDDDARRDLVDDGNSEQEGQGTGGVDPTPTPTPAPVVPAIITPAAQPAPSRFVAVKVAGEGTAVDVRVYDTKKKDWLDENTFRLDPEPALGEVLELDGVKAVYVGRQDFASPSAAPAPAAGPPAAAPYPVAGAVLRLGKIRLDDGILGGTPTKDLRLEIAAADGAPPNGDEIRTNVVFYDTVDGTVAPTRNPVTSMWMNPPVDWKDGGLEELLVTCVQNPSDPGGSPAPAYHGYAVSVYYRGLLQDARAEPADLLQTFPPPKTDPMQPPAPPPAPPQARPAAPAPADAPPPAGADAPPRPPEVVYDNVPKGSPLRREIIIGIREHFYENNRAMAVRNPDRIELSFREFYVEQKTGNAMAVITKVTGNMRYLKPLPMLVIMKRQPNSTWKLAYWISLPLMDQTLEQGLLSRGLPPQFLRH